jgi:hypothetical protein
MASKFKPYAAQRTASVALPHCIVAAETFEGVLIVYERPAMPELGRLGVGVSDLVIHNNNLPDTKHPALVVENTSLQDALTRIKRVMLAHGASAEAVRLIGELSPFSKKELDTMADKLKGKAPAAKEAKTKPVGGGGKAAAAKDAAPAKGKGNPAALAKAQEAAAGKRAELATKKIKVLNKKHGAREGTKRATQLDIVLGAKTVGDAIEAGAQMVDIRFAEAQGFISIG